MRKSLLMFLICLLGWPTGAFSQAVPEAFTSKAKVASGYFATVSRLCVFDDFTQPGATEKFEETWRAVKQILARIEALASVSVPDSDIARFNALAYGESISVSAETGYLVQLAKQMNAQTGGYFDPTVFPLVDLWGFSPRFTYGGDEGLPYDRVRTDGTLPPPDPRYIEAFLTLVDMDGVGIEGDAQAGYRLVKNTPSVQVDGVSYEAQLDLGGIAKGYACDLVMALLSDQGYTFGYFSCGSSSIGLLKNAAFSAKQANDSAFQLEVRKPRETKTNGNAFAVIRVQDQALSSSGDYGANYTLDGDICCHIISPFTGYPLNVPSDGVQQGIASVTLLSGNAAMDDAYSTALCLMGPARAMEYANTHLADQAVVMVLYRADQDVYEVVTNVSPEALILRDPNYVLASEVMADGAMGYTGTLFTGAFSLDMSNNH